MSTETIARQMLADNGETDPHPMLLADTIREIEYASQNGQTFEDEVPAPVYSIGKDSHEVPCDHALCDPLHRNLPEFHEITRRYWIILKDGVRDDSFDVYDRRMDAAAELYRRGLLTHLGD